MRKRDERPFTGVSIIFEREAHSDPLCKRASIIFEKKATLMTFNFLERLTVINVVL
jgi:hypothetical protein